MVYHSMLELKNGRSPRWPGNLRLFWGMISLLLAMWAAYRAELPVLLAYFAAILLWSSYATLTYTRRYKKELEKSIQHLPARHVRLEVHDDGIHETMADVKSFAPWTAIKSFVWFQETLFIELADGRWAIIPGRSLPSLSTSIERIIGVLKQNGIRENSTVTLGAADSARETAQP